MCDKNDYYTARFSRCIHERIRNPFDRELTRNEETTVMLYRFSKKNKAIYTIQIRHTSSVSDKCVRAPEVTVKTYSKIY